MEIHVDLPNDRATRRRLQNRIAQRKFRQSRADALYGSLGRPAGEAVDEGLATPSLSLHDVDLAASAFNTDFLFSAKDSAGPLDTPNGTAVSGASHGTVTPDEAAPVASVVQPTPPPSTTLGPAFGIAHGSSPDDSLGQPAAGQGSPSTSHSDKGWLAALHIAARRGHEPVVRTLLQHGVDCNETDSDGRTALIHAAMDGHEPVAALLLAHGARISDVDRRQRSALHWAVLNRHEDVVCLVLRHYAERGWECGLDAYDDLGWTPLHLAVEKGLEASVRLLLQCGASLHAKARKTCSGDDDRDDSRLVERTRPGAAEGTPCWQSLASSSS